LPFKCATRFGIWADLAVFAATAAGCAGIPVIGSAAVWAAVVLASRGQLNIAAVLIVAAIGNQIAGLPGSQMRGRRGRQLLEHLGPALRRGKKAAVCVLLAVRHHRRPKARQPAAGTPPGPARAPAGRA
jgi:membrane protein DedA with SNARE-associated domain